MSRDAPYSLCFSHMFRWARLRDAIASMKRKHRTTVRAERRLNAARAALDWCEAHAGELHRWPVSQPRVASIFYLKSLAIQIVDNLNAFLNCARGRGFLVSKMMCAVVT